MRRRAQLALRIAFAVALAGCTLGRPQPRLPATTGDDLLRDIEVRRASIHSFRARARLRNGLASLWTREAVLLRPPDALRMDVLSPLGLALALGTDGTVLWAYPPQDQVRYEGPATPENIARMLGAPVRIEDLIAVMLGLPPARPRRGPAALATTDDGEYRLTVPLADGTQQLFFGGDPLVLRRAVEEREGAPTLQVAYGEHENGLPRLIELVSPQAGTTVTLHYDSVELNPALDPTVFAPPPAPTVRPLPSAPPR